MRYTEKATKHRKINESKTPGNVYEVQFNGEFDIDKFVSEYASDISEYLYSTDYDRTLYLQLDSLSATKTVESYLKNIDAKILVKESGYNSDPRSLKKARES